jgi:uncharacterized protein (TIGR03066 family)
LNTSLRLTSPAEAFDVSRETEPRRATMTRAGLGKIIGANRVPVGLLFAFAVMACSPGAPVAEKDYATKIVGGWQGTAGDMKESITFGSDGKFVTQVRPMGFISNTLGQGVTGTISGTWTISGKIITLNIDSTEHEHVVNRTTTSTIESFKPDELVVKSSNGSTSTFVRLL